MINRAYTRYANLKPGLVHDFEHLVSLFNSKFFYVEAKFSLAELGLIYQHQGEELGAYVKRFNNKALTVAI